MSGTCGLFLGSALRRPLFWIILSVAPILAALHFQGDPLIGAICILPAAAPAALCAGWASSRRRRCLAVSLAISPAGQGVLLAGELLVSCLLGTVPALLALEALPGAFPWQMAATVPLTSLATASLILWLEPLSEVWTKLGAFAAGVLSIVPSKPGFVALIAFPGYPGGVADPAARLHPDAYLALSLVLCVVSAVFAARGMRSLGRLPD